MSGYVICILREQELRKQSIIRPWQVIRCSAYTDIEYEGVAWKEKFLWMDRQT